MADSRWMHWVLAAAWIDCARSMAASLLKIFDPNVIQGANVAPAGGSTLRSAASMNYTHVLKVGDGAVRSPLDLVPKTELPQSSHW